MILLYPGLKFAFTNVCNFVLLQLVPAGARDHGAPRRAAVHAKGRHPLPGGEEKKKNKTLHGEKNKYFVAAAAAAAAALMMMILLLLMMMMMIIV